MNLNQRIPLLRWSVWRMAIGARNYARTGQWGDGREAAAAPSAKVCSVEFAEANAEVARRVWAHAGAGKLDFLFLDHDKSAYVPDLLRMLDRGWLHPGSIVVADNVRLPGAPKYREYMRRLQGTHWNTVEHKTHAEYQTLLPDLVLESEYLG
jgi:catechol O-methyltransferase